MMAADDTAAAAESEAAQEKPADAAGDDEKGSEPAEAEAGSKRPAASQSGDDSNSPERPRRRQKSNWDSNETPAEGSSAPGPETPGGGRSKGEGPPPREGDWVSAYLCAGCLCFDALRLTELMLATGGRKWHLYE